MKLLSRLFQRGKENRETVFRQENTGFGLRFLFPQDWEKHLFQEGLPTYQYIVLQQLLEAGEAQEEPDGIHVESEVLCRLDSLSRQILDLPTPWPGRFELEVHGTTSRRDFSLALRPLPLLGLRSCSPVMLEGPFFMVEGQNYLPDAAQWLALHAITEHTRLSPEERSEIVHLQAVFAVQQACRQGAAIDMRHFARLDVTQPEGVGVSVMENADGSIRLVPDLGLGLTPDAVEARLGQLEKDGKKGAVLRVGKKLVLLDERRMAAVHEILSSRIISAREKRQFFKTPGAYLDASLVNLDTGFSLRVHGMEIFQKAYFGQTESDSLAWFGENGQEEPGIFFLDSCLPIVESEDDFACLEQLVQNALDSNREIVPFRDKTILLPADRQEVLESLKGLKRDWQEKLERAERQGDKAESCEPPLQVAVKIDLHDEALPSNLHPTTEEITRLYDGNLYSEQLRYVFHDYQEQGTRWITGLMLPFLERRAGILCGGLLADDMGLGKTFMVLASLNIYRHLARKAGMDKPVLAVMPVVLLENWQQELERAFKVAPFEDVVILQAGAQLRQFRQEGGRRENVLYKHEELPPEGQVRYSLKIGPDFGTGRLDLPGRLVLTNYDTLRDYQFSLCMIDWGCVIFDEAQEIKNPNTIKARAAKGLKADFRLAMTGTPVENSLTDFWSLFDTVKPGLLGSFQSFRRTYVAPIRQESEDAAREKIRCTLGQQLRQAVGSFMLRRTKGDCLSGLPRKIVHDGMKEARYSAVMSGAQLQSYNAVLSTVVAARNSGSTAQMRQILLPSLRKLQAVSLHPALRDGGEPEPFDDTRQLEETLHQSAKLTLLLQILDEIRERQEKVIIFVISKGLQRFLAYALGKRYGLAISVVNGETRSVATPSGRGTASRMELIRRFEAREGFNIICMSPLAAGVGLTVVGANNVVHLERHWNPAKEAQATDRVYRLGATRDVHVYIPVLQHPEKMSFDVNLNTLLQRKIALTDAVMTEESVRGDDFDIGAIFGLTLREERILPDWLQGLDWAAFEALTALLARREWGGEVFLTPRSGDHGADIVVRGRRNAIIQCKSSLKAFAESTAVPLTQAACMEYSRCCNHPFDTAILAVNAPQVRENVRSRARDLGVIIWDRPALEALLEKHTILYSELGRMLEAPRLNCTSSRDS